MKCSVSQFFQIALNNMTISGRRIAAPVLKMYIINVNAFQPFDLTRSSKVTFKLFDLSRSSKVKDHGIKNKNKSILFASLKGQIKIVKTHKTYKVALIRTWHSHKV